MAVARSTVRDDLLDLPEMRKLGWKITVTATTGGLLATTTDPLVNQYASSVQGLTGKWLYIPSASGVNQRRLISSLSVTSGTATLTTTGPNYTATYTDVTGYILSCDPTWLNNLFNLALRRIFTQFEIPVAPGPIDYDMSASGVTNWTDGTGGGSITKQTTAAEVYTGRQSMVITNGAAAGYGRSAQVRTRRSGKVWFRGIFKADVGTGVLRLRDGSGTSIDSVSNTGEEWVYVEKGLSVGASVDLLTLDLEGTGASDSIDWDCVEIVKEEDRLINLPSWIDKSFQVLAVSWAEYHTSIASGVYLASSRELHPLTKGVHYEYVHHVAEANPYAIRIRDEGVQYLDRQWWITGLRPFSDIATFSAEADTTDADEDRLLLELKSMLGKAFPQGFPGVAAAAAIEIREEERLSETPAPRASPEQPMFRRF